MLPAAAAPVALPRTHSIFLDPTTASYPARDLLKLLKATDATPGDQNNLKMPDISLVFKGRGDKVTFKKTQAAWEYYCPSDKPCANYLGNKLNVTVTDGLSNVTGLLTQPVKPRPGECVQHMVSCHCRECCQVLGCVTNSVMSVGRAC
jgi:hypothetical protein